MLTEKEAKQIAKEQGFEINKKLHEAFYYDKRKPRNFIFGGLYKGKKAVFKIYDDPRIIQEAKSAEAFAKSNKSKILITPKIFKSHTENKKKGWVISEELPGSAKQLKSPLNQEQRKEFLDVYLEYRKNLPKNVATKTLSENMSASEFHIFRISRWFQLANDREAERDVKIINPKKFIPLYEKALDFIDRKFKDVEMHWCHGLFRPKGVFKDDDKYYLIDFSLAHFRPEAHELSIIIWADWMMDSGDTWKWSYTKWKKGIIDWLEDMQPTLKKLKIRNSLMRAALAERVLGSILADITASDRPRAEQIKRNDLLYRLLDDLIENNIN